jgi:hypothetical protein
METVISNEAVAVLFPVLGWEMSHPCLEQNFGVSAKIGVCPPRLLVASVRHLRQVSKTLATIYGNG